MTTTSVHVSELRRTFRGGVLIVLAFFGLGGGWAALTPISGAVIAMGQVVVDSNAKKVQHPNGGVVAALYVRDGDAVRAGDLLMKLDETVLRASLALLEKQIDELEARQGRLEAERDGGDRIDLPERLMGRLHLADAARAVAEESRLFALRRAQRQGQRTQLIARREQLREEIAGIDAQEEARQRQLTFIERELEGVRDLFARQLVTIVRLMALEREGANLQGQLGQLAAARAQALGRIAEIELQMAQIDHDLRSEAVRDLRETQLRLVELRERAVAADDNLRRAELRAPMDGFVHQLQVHTVGGVVTPAEPTMLLVPSEDALLIEGRVEPIHVDQLRPGQRVTVKVLAGNQRTLPEVAGQLMRVSPDVSRDAQTGATFYTVRVHLPESERRRLGNLRIVPGMMAELFIETEARTPLDYLVRPLRDQIARAFRER